MPIPGDFVLILHFSCFRAQVMLLCSAFRFCFRVVHLGGAFVQGI